MCMTLELQGRQAAFSVAERDFVEAWMARRSLSTVDQMVKFARAHEYFSSLWWKDPKYHSGMCTCEDCAQRRAAA